MPDKQTQKKIENNNETNLKQANLKQTYIK